jgi:hypothetical protein
MRNTWLVGGIVGFILALLLMRSNTTTIAADAPAPVQKWEYATFEERVRGPYYAWKSPHSKMVWDDNFPDVYRKMGGKGDATEAVNFDLFNLIAADGWEYMGAEDSLFFRHTRVWVFRRPVR